MKQAILTLLQLILTAGGGALTSNGVTTDGEAQTLVGALLTIAGIVWVIIERNQKAKAAAGVIAPCIALCLMSNAAVVLVGCGALTLAQKETVTNVLIEVAKAGLKFGLSAIAQNNPKLAAFIPDLEAKFQITFADPTAVATPETFALAIRNDVLATVADPELQKLITDLLADAVRDEATKSATASAPSAPPRENQITYALRVAESLKN